MELIQSGNYKQNIETLGGQFEGDMVLEEKQRRALLGLEKTGLINTNYRWPNGVVPYVLADGYFTQGQVEQIERGLRAIEAASCIRFVNRTVEENYVEVIVSEILISHQYFFITKITIRANQADAGRKLAIFDVDASS